MSRLEKVAYAFGHLGITLSYQAVSTYVQFFYLDVVRLAPLLMAPAMLLYAVWNSINDPLAGILSDRTRTRWGQRIPYVLFLTAPLAIFFALVWIPPLFALENQNWLFAYFLFALFIFDGLHTLVGLNLLALFPVMFPTLKERAQVSSYRQVFGILGSLLGIASPPIIYAALGWGAMGALFGVIALVSIYASMYGMREPERARDEEQTPLRDALIAPLRNKSFVTFMAFSVLLQFAFLLITAVVPFYAKYVLHEEETVTSLLLFVAFAVAFPMVFVWGNVITRVGARNAMLAALSLFAFVLVPLFFATHTAQTLVIMAAVGVPLAGLFVLPDIMLSDVIDEDEQKSGLRREGIYFGLQGLLIRAGIILQSLALNVTLTATGYDASLPVAAQPPVLELGLRVLVSAAPILALVVAIVCVLWYPLHGARLLEVHHARAIPSQSLLTNGGRGDP